MPFSKQPRVEVAKTTATGLCANGATSTDNNLFRFGAGSSR